MAEIICDYCGKKTYVNCWLSDYVYKRVEKKTNGNRYFCSYSCMRKAEDEFPLKYEKRRAKSEK